MTQRHLREMFGTEPRQYIDLEGDRIEQIRTLYSRQLRIAGNISYVNMLHLQSTSQGTDYSLVFGTHSWESMEKMKDIFWEMDPTCGSTYSALPTNQPYLIPPKPDYESFAREIRHAFGKDVNVCELEEYILTSTYFRKKDIEHVLPLLIHVDAN